jgi:hypothetical protein
MPKCFIIMPITTPIDSRADYGNDPDHFGSTDVTVGNFSVTMGSCSWSSGEWWAESAAGEVGHGDE